MAENNSDMQGPDPVRSSAFRRPPNSLDRPDESTQPNGMYKWRKWTVEQREAAMTERMRHRYPFHSPPHLDEPGHFRLISAACHDHAHFLDNKERLAWFESELLNQLKNHQISCVAWVVLTNHYHALVKIDDIKRFTKNQGEFHGRTSFEINRKDNKQGRKIWYRCQDRCMRSERHFCTTLNYIHNNPVKHGYVKKWGDWPYSSFHSYLAEKGREWLLELWREYPVLNYGDKWDI